MHLVCILIMSPHSPKPRGWGGYIVFGADPIGVSVHFFISVYYLLNQLMDFAQACIYTLLGGGEELIRFGDLDLIFKVTASI